MLSTGADWCEFAAYRGGVTEDERREQIRAWVERSCAEQGVPVKVTDPTVIRKVAALLGAPARDNRAPKPYVGHGRARPAEDL